MTRPSRWTSRVRTSISSSPWDTRSPAGSEGARQQRPHGGIVVHHEDRDGGVEITHQRHPSYLGRFGHQLQRVVGPGFGARWERVDGPTQPWLDLEVAPGEKVWPKSLSS